MTRMIFDFSMSLDGFVTASNVRPEEPMGDGGQRLHDWAFGEDERNRERNASAVPSGGVAEFGQVENPKERRSQLMANDSQAHQQPPRPNPDLRNLGRLVGTWKVSGGAQGRVTFEWMEGGFFLIQHVDLEQYGQKIKGFEIIGHEHPFGAEPSEEIKSRFYDNMGNTLDYVYELEGDTLTIWGGEKGSPAYSKGTFSDDGNTLSSEWVYPGGGGYQSTMTRSK